MFSDDTRYVRRDDPDNPFPGGVALYVHCANCGTALLLPPAAAPFCSGTADVSACREGLRRTN